MNDKEFGLRVRRLREKANITREEFCGDEIELSVRQLSRIEAGSSKPTFSKISFIANRLGMTLYELMPDYVAVDSRYTQLKYQLLRTPTYGEMDRVSKRDELVTEIYDEFYDELPEEEQLVVDTMRSLFDVLATDSQEYGKDIIEEYVYQIIQKQRLTINDFLICRLFMIHISIGDLKKDDTSYETFLTLAQRLPEEERTTDFESLFVLRDLLFSVIYALYSIKEHVYILACIETIEAIMQRTQDFQKKPIVGLVRWKYVLKTDGDSEKAKDYYDQAVMFAELLGDSHLVEQLNKEWEQDIKNCT